MEMPEIESMRTIFISEDINEIVVETVTKKLLLFDNMSNEPINLFIHSDGGHVVSGFGIIDVMNYIKSPVWTIGLGNVSSMGSLILAAGSNRSCFENTRIMIHKLSSGINGQYDDLKIEVKELDELEYKMNSFLASQCNTSQTKMRNIMKKNKYMDPKEAMKIGLIDNIIRRK